MRRLFLHLLLLVSIGLDAVKFSFGIMTHNETDCLKVLLNFLVAHRKEGDEIVLVDDYSTNEKTLEILKSFEGVKDLHQYKRKLDMNFAAQRNFLKSKCSGNYCVFLDPDECPTEFLMSQLTNIVASGADSYGIPRINLIEEINESDRRINAKGYVSWPDYQERIFKNISELYYVKNIHEYLTSSRPKKRVNVPEDERYAIVHSKHIETWDNAHQFYLQCYKKWLVEAIKSKQVNIIRNILMDNPGEHCLFVKDLEVQELIPKGKKKRILKLCESIEGGNSALIVELVKQMVTL